MVRAGLRWRVCAGVRLWLPQGAWPFGSVEAIWAVVAVHRWRRRIISKP